MLDRVRHLQAAVDSGASILVGGAPEEGSLAFPPTVLKVTDEDTPLMKEETFGPLLPIVIVDSEDDAIDRANASRFGLTTSVRTRRVNHGAALADRLRSGVITVNNHGFTAAISEAPWTGAGDSGFGVTNSAHALAELTRPRLCSRIAAARRASCGGTRTRRPFRTIAFAMAKLRGGAGFFGRIRAFFRSIAAFPKRFRVG